MMNQRKGGLQRKVEYYLRLEVDALQSRVKRCALIIYKAFVYANREFRNDRCFEKGALLSYVTLLSIIPTLFVFFFIVSAFGNLSDKFIETLILFIQNSLPPNLVEPVSKYLQDRFSGGVKAGTIGIVGIVFLLLSAIALLGVTENAFNDIWNVRRSRSAKVRLPVYISFIFLTPLLLGIWLYTQTSPVYLSIAQRLPNYESINTAGSWIGAFLFVWFIISLMYYFIPNAKMRLWSVLFGSFVTTILWFVSRVLFNYYVTKVVQIQGFYGALGAIPIFFVWVYMSWEIILFGLELSYAGHYWRRLDYAITQERYGKRYDPLIAVLLTLEIARRFWNGEQPVGMSELSEQFRLSGEEVNSAIENLEEAGIIVSSPDNVSFFLPARPLEHIALDEVLNAASSQHTLHAYDPTGKEHNERVCALMSKLKQLQVEYAGKLTVKDIVSKSLNDLMPQLEIQKHETAS